MESESYSRTDRRNRGESIGTVDHAFDDDRPSSQSHIRGDSACAIAWPHDDFQGIEVYVDPALTDRQAEICQSLEALAGAHDDIDGLSAAVMRYAEGGGLSAGLYERPADTTTAHVVAVVFTIG